MAAKNSIRVKKEFMPRLLRAAQASGIELTKCKVESKTHVYYTVKMNHIQSVFELGYVFCTLHQENL